MTPQLSISRRGFIKGVQATALIPMVGLSETLTQVKGLSRDACLSLLTTWCDGLLALQVNTPMNPDRHGGLACPACEVIHGRSFDAIYPLLHVAHATGEAKYLEAAIRVQSWAESLSLPNGCWLSNFGEQWHATTAFHAQTLSEALRNHGAILDATTRARWTDRLASAMTFLDGLKAPLATDARLAEVTQDTLTTLAANTHKGLLYPAPYTHGQKLPCIQETISQAKALALALDCA
jgi:hypothetical protein